MLDDKRGVEPTDPILNSEVTLYSPQALAIADGSPTRDKHVGLIELDSHVIGDVPKEPAKDAGGAAKQDNA